MDQYPRLPIRINPPVFSHGACKQRNAAERYFYKIKRLPAVATRYDKRDDTYLASVKPAAIRILPRCNESMT